VNELDAQQQLFVIMMEECGELIQQCSKCLRQPDYNWAHSVTDDNHKKLVEEVGDVYAMIELMQEFDLISWSEIEKRAEVKKEKLKQWSDLVT
jgi:hypothetical protein